MNPIVLIATHHRLEITSKNIDSLLKQSIVPQICLVVSDWNEEIFYKNKYPFISIVFCENKPLGRKWGIGVEYCMKLKADPLIITGSDDILGDGFIERAIEIMKKYHFIGLMRWWQHYKGVAYLCDYLANQPIGGGRVYSFEMLQKIKIFDITVNKHLDDFGWENVLKSGLSIIQVSEVIEYGLEIHAIKGDWSMLNPFNVMHKNVKILKYVPSKSILSQLYC